MARSAQEDSLREADPARRRAGKESSVAAPKLVWGKRWGERSRLAPALWPHSHQRFQFVMISTWG